MSVVQITEPNSTLADITADLIASYVELFKLDPADPLLPVIAEAVRSLVFPRIMLADGDGA